MSGLVLQTDVYLMKNSFLYYVNKQDSSHLNGPTKVPLSTDNAKTVSSLTDDPIKDLLDANGPTKVPLSTDDPKNVSVHTDNPEKESLDTNSSKKITFRTDDPQKDLLHTDSPKKVSLSTDSTKKVPVVQPESAIELNIKNSTEEKFVGKFQNYIGNKQKSSANDVYKCPEWSITRRYEIPPADLACKPRKPLPSGCKYAMETYIYNQSKNTCKNKPNIKNICDRSSEGKFSCSFDACGDHNYNGEIFIHIFDKTDGDIDVYTKINKSMMNDLNNKVELAANNTIKDGYNFMFLSCGEDIKKTQFLILPPLLPNIDGNQSTNVDDQNADVTAKKPTPKININVFICDSISRAHFYRSLKHSINTINDINSNSQKYRNAEVLDFELFQAIHGHSQENTYALMTGQTFLSNVSSSEREKTPSEINKFYKFLQEHKYETLYQDDMCYECGYGLKREIGALGKPFVEYKKILDMDSNIDDYGKVSIQSMHTC